MFGGNVPGRPQGMGTVTRGLLYTNGPKWAWVLLHSWGYLEGKLIGSGGCKVPGIPGSKLWGPKVERCRPQGLRAATLPGVLGAAACRTPPQPQAQPPGTGWCHGGTRAEPDGSGRSRTVAEPLKPVPPPRPAPGPTAGGTRGRRWWAAAGLLRQPGPRSPDGAGPEPPPAALSRTEPPGTASGGRGGGAAEMLGSAPLGRSPGGTAGRELRAALASRGAQRRGGSPGHVPQRCGAALPSLSRRVPLRAF